MSPQQTRISAKKSSSIPIGPKYTPAPVLQPKATKKPDRQLPEWQPEGGGMVSPLQRLLDSNAVQAKLTIGEPNDKYEQEADTVAQDVVQRLHSPVSETPPETAVQRETEAGKHQLQRKPILQRTHAVGGEPASADLEGAINRAKGGGQPLEAGLQRSMSQAMGADFSGVRVHTDGHADQLNKSIQAKAFTTGQDIFFAQRQYDPGSTEGQELIAHELTHVVQQKGRVNGAQLGKGVFQQINACATQTKMDHAKTWYRQEEDYHQVIQKMKTQKTSGTTAKTGKKKRKKGKKGGAVKITGTKKTCGASRKQIEELKNRRPQYGPNQELEVWEAAKKDPDGRAICPNTGKHIAWTKGTPRQGIWDMGHKEGHEYKTLWRKLATAQITYQQFLQEYRNPENYQVEDPTANRSHAYEAGGEDVEITDDG